MALTYKRFRCIDCGCSGQIITEEIAAYRSKCARGTAEPIADQARAAEQGQACKHVHPLRQITKDGETEYICADCGTSIEHKQPAQTPAGDVDPNAEVVTRMMNANFAASGTPYSYPPKMCKGMAAALAVAREGYVSLEEVEKESIALIAKERERQIKGEGWTLDHDDAHKYGELAAAAACYAHHANCQVRKFQPSYVAGRPSDWPWDATWWKPSVYPVRNLVKAGALIAAEIDRLARLAKPAAQTDEQKVEAILIEQDKAFQRGETRTIQQSAAEIVAALKAGKQ